ncbi:MAG: Gfo/Idh/MocA family oxidoreductase [Candidatus Hodarchaeota archaeon]
MNGQYDVIQVGLGPMGKIIAKLLLTRKNINLKAVIDIDPEICDKTLDRILNIKEGSNIRIKTDLDYVLSREKVDVVFIATSSSLEQVAPLIKKAITAGCNVISLCEELSYPFQNYSKLSKELDLLAKSKNVTIIGTGINPGYLMDLFPIFITAPCQKVESIKVTRMMNSAKRRESFQRKIGTGLKIGEFHEKISKGEITGHVGLTQSIEMIIAALGIEYDEIHEFAPKAIITDKEFITSYGERISKGYVCGLSSKCIANKENKEIITLDFIAYAGEHEEYDSIEVEGIPPIYQKIIGGIHGDIGTSGIVANLIPKVLNARPGLLTMKDLPVPCYTENIMKS